MGGASFCRGQKKVSGHPDRAGAIGRCRLLAMGKQAGPEN